MLTEQDKRFRADKIGASEIYKALDPAKQYGLFHQKVTGQSPIKGDEPWIRLGHYLEPITALDYADRRRRSGQPVRLIEPSATLQHPSRPWLCGTPDRLPLRWGSAVVDVTKIETVFELAQKGLLSEGLECKSGGFFAESRLDESDQWGIGLGVDESRLATWIDRLGFEGVSGLALARILLSRYNVSRYLQEDVPTISADEWGEEGTDQIPRLYLAQVYAYLDMTRLPRWDLHRLRIGKGRIEFVTYIVKADESLQGAILDRAEKFYRDHIAAGKAPRPQTPEEREQELMRVFPRLTHDVRPATPEERDKIEALREAQQRAADAKREADSIRLELKESIGACKGLKFGPGRDDVLKAISRQGQVKIDALEAITTVCGLLRDRGMSESEVQEIADAAIASATRTGKPSRVLTSPKGWTNDDRQ